jgi:hypothetical protein
MIQHTNSGRGGKIDEKKKKKSHHCECPLNVEWHLPVVVFHTLMVLSALPLAKVTPSGLQATEKTLRLKCHESAHGTTTRRKFDEKKKSHQSECPLRVDTH